MWNVLILNTKNWLTSELDTNMIFNHVSLKNVSTYILSATFDPCLSLTSLIQRLITIFSFFLSSYLKTNIIIVILQINVFTCV